MKCRPVEPGLRPGFEDACGCSARSHAFSLLRAVAAGRDRRLEGVRSLHLGRPRASCMLGFQHGAAGEEGENRVAPLPVDLLLVRSCGNEWDLVVPRDFKSFRRTRQSARGGFDSYAFPPLRQDTSRSNHAGWRSYLRNCRVARSQSFCSLVARDLPSQCDARHAPPPDALTPTGVSIGPGLSPCGAGEISFTAELHTPRRLACEAQLDLASRPC